MIVPVIISRQSGVARFSHHALTVDFWDVDELAGKICAALTYDALTREMSSAAARSSRP